MIYGFRRHLLGCYTSRERVERLRELQFRPEAIAYYLGMSRENVVHILNTPPRLKPKKPSLTERFREPLQEAARLGWSIDKTAAELGISRPYVTILRQRFGLSGSRRGPRVNFDEGWDLTADELDPEFRALLNSAPTRRKQIAFLLKAGASVNCTASLLGIKPAYVKVVRSEIRDIQRREQKQDVLEHF